MNIGQICNLNTSVLLNTILDNKKAAKLVVLGVEGVPFAMFDSQ